MKVKKADPSKAGRHPAVSGVRGGDKGLFWRGRRAIFIGGAAVTHIEITAVKIVFDLLRGRTNWGQIPPDRVPTCLILRYTFH